MKITSQTPNRLSYVIGELQLASPMALYQLRQKLLVNGNLPSLQGREFFAIVVHQDNVVAQIGEARPRHQPYVS